MNSPDPHFRFPVTTIPVKFLLTDDRPDWRDFRSVSTHPDGDEIFFVEVHQSLPDKCRVLRLNLQTRALVYFDLPAGYIYPEVHVSPSGKKLALLRISPKVRNFPANLENRDIVLLNIDGSGLEVLRLAPGTKVAPALNAQDDRVAFWRGQPRTETGANPEQSVFDLYEFDFKANQEDLFAMQYRFSRPGPLLYTPNGEALLAVGEAPLEIGARLGMRRNDYHHAYPNNIFRFSRGQSNWCSPIFNGELFKDARAPLFRTGGGMIFHAEARKGGPSVFLQKPDGSLFQWCREDNNNAVRTLFRTGDVRSCAVAGDHLIGIYNHRDISGPAGLSRFLMLDMRTGSWSSLPIPELFCARPIAVA